MFRRKEQSLLIKIQVHVDEMHKCHKGLAEANSHMPLLPERCVPLGVGRNVANTNHEPTEKSQQMKKSML